MKQLTDLFSQIFGIFVLCYFCSARPLQTQQSHFTTQNLGHEISIDGSAIFFQDYATQRKVLWVVQCDQPFTDCEARAPGILLRLDNQDQLRILTDAGPNARVSLQHKNFILRAPELEQGRLSEALIAQVSHPQSFIVIEEGDHVYARQPTIDINRVTSYLKWLKSPSARKTKDARSWPDQLMAKDEPTALEIHPQSQISQRQDFQRQLVPADKPQSEFAIRSQGGSSFFSKTGRAGY